MSSCGWVERGVSIRDLQVYYFTAELFAEQTLRLVKIWVPVDDERFLALSSICNPPDSTDDLVCDIFINLLQNYSSTDWIQKNVAVQNINNILSNQLQEDIFIYNSINNVVNYPIECLNSL